MTLPNRVLVIAAALAGVTVLFFARHWQTTASIENANEVVDRSQRLLTLFVDAETGQRGYLITGLNNYLDPYQQAAAVWPNEFRLLRRLVADNPRQQQRLDRLDVVAKDKLAELAETIRIYRDGGKEAAWTEVLGGRGKRAMDEIRSLVRAIQSEETQLLAQRQQHRKELRTDTALGLFSCFLFCLLLLYAANHRQQSLRANKLEFENESKFRSLFEVAPFGIVTVDRERKSIVDFNTAMCSSLGYTREEFSRMQPADYVAVPADQLQANDAALEKLFSAANAPVHFETKHRTKTGEIRDVFVTALPLELQGRQYSYSTYQDVTERKLVDAVLLESEAQFRTLANAIPNLCWIAHGDGGVFWYNQVWYDYTGTTPEQMEGWGWQAVHDQTLLPQVLERWQGSIATGNPFEMVLPLLRADGVFRSFLTRVQPVRDRSGKVIRWFGAPIQM